jgi:hypothetical protein
VDEVVFATVDHSDIRGSKPHNRDPSGCLGLSGRVRSEDLPHRTIEDSPFRVPPRPLPTLPPFAQGSLRGRAVSVGPSGPHHYPPQARIPRLCDLSSSRALSARVFTGHDSCVTH